MSGKQTVNIKFTGDASGFKSATAEISTQAETVGQKLGSIGKIASGFVIGQAMTKLPGLLSSAADSAVSLEQNAKKAALVFGDSLGTVEKWAETSAHGMGLTNSEAVTLAAGMADLLIPMGMTRDEAAEMSTETVGLAGALAEWSGGTKSAAEVSEILTKAMLGETDGLKSLGISISANDIDTRTALNSTNGMTFASGEAARAYATQQLIMEKSADAQTAYANGADSTARAQAEASAEMKEAQEQISTALLPAITAGTAAFAGLASLLAETVVPAFAGILGALGPIVGFLHDNLVPVLLVIAPLLTGAVVAAFVAWTVATWNQFTAWLALNTAMLPWIAALVVVGVVVAALYLAWQSNFLGIRDIVDEVIGYVGPYITTTIDGLKTLFETVWPIISSAVTTAVEVVRPALENWLNNLKILWDTIFPAIQAVVETVFPIISAVVTTYIGLVKTEIELALSAIQAVWGVVWPAIQAIVETVWPIIDGVIRTILGPLVTFISGDLSSIQETWDTIWGAIQTTAETVWEGIETAANTINDIYDTVTGVLGDIKAEWDRIWDTFASKVQGVVDTVKGIVSGLIGAINGVIGSINDSLSFSFTTPGFDMPGPIPDIPSKTFSFDAPDIPYISDPFGGGLSNSLSAGAPGEFGAGVTDTAPNDIGGYLGGYQSIGSAAVGNVAGGSVAFGDAMGGISGGGGPGGNWQPGLRSGVGAGRAGHTFLVLPDGRVLGQVVAGEVVNNMAMTVGIGGR